MKGMTVYADAGSADAEFDKMRGLTALVGSGLADAALAGTAVVTTAAAVIIIATVMSRFLA
jgi:hypothetical protein